MEESDNIHRSLMIKANIKKSLDNMILKNKKTLDKSLLIHRKYIRCENQLKQLDKKMDILLSDFKNELMNEHIFDMTLYELEDEIEFKSEERDRRYIAWMSYSEKIKENKEKLTLLQIRYNIICDITRLF
jgi:hypothetical protein